MAQQQFIFDAALAPSDQPRLSKQLGYDLVGKCFGKWTVLELAKPAIVNGRSYKLWTCECGCGAVHDIHQTSLVAGTSECCKKCTNTCDGLSVANRSEYNAWNNMKIRCYDPNYKCFSSYGGRGIRVCDHWLASFLNFFGDLGPKPSVGNQLDRIDVDGDYEPDNCRWVTVEVQSRNKRNNRWLTYKGETKCLADWAHEYGMTMKRLFFRLSKGWSLEDALERPLRPQITPELAMEVYQYKGQLSTKEVCELTGIAPEKVRDIFSGRSWAGVTGQ